jgi:hypothetical protein
MIALVLLVSAGLLAGAFFLIYQITVNVFGSLIERRQRDADFVLYTGRVPPTWIKRRPRTRLAIALARRRVRRKLASVIDYFKHTPLVPGEPEREDLVRRLSEVRERWKSEPWEQMLLP